MTEHIYITDKQLASLVEISEGGLRKILGGFSRGGEGRKTRVYTIVDFMAMNPVGVGGFRRWPVKDVARVLGISADEVRHAIFGE